MKIYELQMKTTTAKAGPQGISLEFPEIWPSFNSRKNSQDIFSSLNLDYLRTKFTVKNFNYALNAKQWYFVTWSYNKDFEKWLF